MQLFIALVAIVSAGTPDPRLRAPDGAVAPGAAVALVFQPGPGLELWIDGCSTVELERQEGERWVPVTGVAGCDGSAAARKVGKDLTVTLASPPAGTYRGVVAWGAACVEGRSFATASCRSRGVARSGEFTVSAAAEPAQR